MTQIFYLDGSQNYLVFNPTSSYLTFKNGKIGSCQCKGMSVEIIKHPHTIDTRQ